MPSKHYGTWRARWRDERGKLRSQNCPDHRSAKELEQRKRTEVAEIRAGLRSPAPPKKSFEDFCDAWVEKRTAVKRSAKDDLSIIRSLRPTFGGLLVGEISSELSDGYRAERTGKLADKTIYNHLMLLTGVLNAAKDWGWIDKVPKIRKPRIRLRRRDFRYLRTVADIRRFLRAAAEEGPLVFAMYATAIYTGMRAGELAGLRRDAIDRSRRLITVMRSYDGPTKSDEIRYVPILDPLLPILRKWLLQNPGSVVFPNQASGVNGPSARVFQEVLKRVLDGAGFPTSTDKRGRVRRVITFHGLRHTFASHWAMSGGNLWKLQKILGHSSIELTMRYAHLSPTAFSEEYGLLGCDDPLAESTVLELPTGHPAAASGDK